MLFGVLPLDSILPGLMRLVFATGEITKTFELDYGGAADAGWQGYYSAEKNLSPTVTIAYEPGKKIKRAQLMRDGVPVGTIPEAEGKASWTGSVATIGLPMEVWSRNNSKTPTYFAWYRYSYTNAKKGWFAEEYDENGNLKEFYCESGPTELINGVAMPKHPSCSAPVIFGANRTQPFKFDGGQGDYIDSRLVKVISFDNVKILKNEDVTGPEGTYGKSEYETSFNPITNAQVIKNPNGSSPEFYIKYTQSFPAYPNGIEPASVNPAIKILSAPGARLMVYFGSFSFDIKGETYKHPNEVRVTYEDAVVPEPDITDIRATPAQSCIEINKSMSFYLSFKNYGSTYSGSFNVKVSVDGSVIQTIPYNGISSGETKTGEFLYKFTTATTKTFTVQIDSLPGEKNTADNTKTFSFTAKTSCSGGGDPDPDPGPEVVEADFNIWKTPSIQYGENNTFQPQIRITGSKDGAACTLKTVTWKVSQGSIQYEETLTNAYAVGFSGPPYPKGMGGGTVNVTMTVLTTCGTTKTVGPKSFDIIVPSNNRPPVFEPGWFEGGNSFAYPKISQTVVGSYVDLGIVHDPLEQPPTPYDPEGDGIIYTFDFAGSDSVWIRSLKEDYGFWEHDEHFRMIKADVLGTHSIRVCAQDVRGANADCRTATLSVVPPNPIPIITGGDGAVEGRPLPEPFSCASSYTPYKYRTISQCLWGGDKRDMYPTSGYYTVTLDVIDSGGLKNRPEDQAAKTIYVRPDLPPVPDLDNPGVGIRNVAMYFKEKSYSPDNDPMFNASVSLLYDSDHDGSFSDETVIPITLDSGRNFSYTPTKVGKYAIRVSARESVGYMKSATQDFFFEVVNEAPEASFYVQGSDFQPPEVITRSFSAATLLHDPSWKTSSLAQPNKGKDFALSPDGALATGKSLVEQGLSPLNANSLSRIFNLYCGSFWGYCWGLGEMVKPNIFLGDWSNGWINLNSYGFTYYNPVHPMDEGKGYWPNSYSAIINYDMGRVMFRASDHCTCSVGGYRWYTYVFHLSDVENATLQTPTQNTWKPQPLYYDEYWVPFSNPDYINVKPPDPPSSIWQYPAPKPVFTVGGKESFEFVTALGSKPGKVADPTERRSPAFGGDYAGNRYHYVCTEDGNIYTPYICDLQKRDSNGHVLWTIPDVAKLGDGAITGNYNEGVIRYLTPDNSRIVISTGAQLHRIYDNNTGAFLYEVMSETLPAFAATKMAYVSKFQVGSNDEDIYYNNYLNVLDLNSLTTATTFLVKSTYWGESSTWFAAPSQPVVSADNRILVATNTALLIFDLNGSLVTQIDRPAGNGGTNPYKPIIMEDGSVAIEYYYDKSAGEGSYSVWMIAGDANRTADVYSFGQFYNSNETLADGEVSAKIKLNYDNFKEGVSFGISARMADNRNMYRMEITAKKTRLTKIVNGVKTTLQEVSYPISFGTYYDVKLKLNGNRLRGYLGGVPLLDVTDSTFTSGMFGPYSEVEYVHIKDFFTTTYSGNSSKTMNTAIVGTSAEYVLSYSDLENDPAIPDMSRWTFTHVEPNKFLDAGDGFSGLSAYNGQTVTAPVLVLDKVGRYKVDYQVPDDPAPAGYKYPNGTFGEYRKFSDLKTEYVIIHRRPIAQFTVWSNADGTIGWNDTSYDPDRWLSPWNYSTEATGIDYAATRGITERRYSYTDPEGITQYGKLTRPTKTGTYTVRLAVKDEYGAWSDWAEQTIGVTMPVPNTPPNVELTFPSGSQANPSYVNTLRPTITWNQWDADPDTTFAAYRVMIKDEWGNVVRDTGTKPQGTTATTAQWTLDFDLAIGQKYQVQVQVSDGTAWSAWSNIGWLVTNRPPQAAMTFPSGSQESPTVISQLRPTFQWSQTDPDPGTIFQYFELEVWNEANTERLLTSGQHWQGTGSTIGSWTASADLPPRQKLRVRVRVFDGFAWSDWSEERWLYINRAPIPDFDWSPKPIWEGDTVHLTNKSTDPDLDPLTSTWEIRTPSGEVGIYGMKDVISVFTAPGLYTVTLTVSDGLESRSVTRTLEAAPLTIRSDVRHTPEWRNIHQGKGHQIDVAPKDFYSGEVFVVETVSSPAPVAEAVAWIDAQGKSGKALYASATLTARADSAIVIEGELFDEMWMSETDGFPEGVMPVHFRIRYANGVVKTEDVPIRIIGNVYEAVNVHRRQ